MRALPPELVALVDELVARAGLTGGAAREARADLEQHLADGLSSGRSVEELVAAFGDPAIAAPMLARSPAPDAHRFTGRGDGFLSTLRGDVRHAARSLLKTPSLAVTATIVLALGVGANAVVFTVLNELFLRPLPVEDPSTLVDIWAEIPGGNSFLGVSYADFVTYRDEVDALTGLAAFTGRRLDMGDRASAVDVIGSFVTPGYLTMLGVGSTLGRASFPPEANFGDPPVAVLSHALWSESFGSDPDIVGTTILIEDQPVTIIGVGPEGFYGHFIGFRSDLWLPLAAADPLIPGFDPNDRSQKSFELIGRRREGVSVGATREALNTVAAEIERRYPELNRGHRLGVTPTTGLDHSLQSAVMAFVAILSSVSLLVLLIACLNVGSVLLVRAMAREREIAVRLALGAGRGRLLLQLMTETSVLVSVGAVVGVAVAMRIDRVLADVLPVLTGGLRLDLTVDWRVLGLTGLVALLASTVATLAPALHALRKEPASVLRGRGSDKAGVRLRAGLVVGQVTVSVVLVLATGLFVRALVEGGRVHPGFDADAIATFALPRPQGREAGDARQLVRDIVARVAELPATEAVAVADGPPIGVARTPTTVTVPGVPSPPDTDGHMVDARRVGPGYLATLGVPLVRGRDFDEADDRDGSAVAVASAAFADRFWPGESPLGRFIQVDGVETEIVGVAENTRYLVQDITPDPFLYLARPIEADGSLSIAVRGSASALMSAEIQAIVDAAIPGARRIRLRPARETLDDALLPQRLGSIVIGSMGVVALLLAAVGLYGLVQLTVSRDASELALRLALGGGPLQLTTVVLKKGLLLVVAGTAAGVGIALLVAPSMAAFLTGVSPRDPLTYGAVVGSFAVVALVASWLPARRALRIHPADALRGQ